MFKRFFTTTTVALNLKKQGLKLCKMVKPNEKRHWFTNPINPESSLPSVKSLTKTKYEPSKSSTRRMAMLNKMFMKNITDMMSTGTVSMEIVGRGIEISKVKVTPDFQTVNVFWVCKGDSTDAQTELVLNKIAGPLRHELSTLRVMGEVPHIRFVKDREEALIANLDRALRIADYGEDYTPTDLGHMLKSEFSLNTTLSPEIKAKIKQLEDDSPVPELPMPEMTHNVYGLDHDKIMNRLMAARKKSKDAWSNLDPDNNLVTYRATADVVPETSVGDAKKDLAEFLKKRQILQNKLHKDMLDARRQGPLNIEQDRQEDPYVDSDVEEEYVEEDDDYFYEKDYHSYMHESKT